VNLPSHVPPRTQQFSGQIPVRFDGANRFYFDLPSSCRGVGSNNGSARGNRVVNGFVFMAGRDEPVAKLTICFDSERFADRDPLSTRDFQDLNRS
jgi:hypothetical protein